MNVPEQKASSGVKAKSPSQRLRNTIFVLWKQKGERGDFESFYDSIMEQLIENIKDKLE